MIRIQRLLSGTAALGKRNPGDAGKSHQRPDPRAMDDLFLGNDGETERRQAAAL